MRNKGTTTVKQVKQNETKTSPSHQLHKHGGQTAKFTRKLQQAGQYE